MYAIKSKKNTLGLFSGYLGGFRIYDDKNPWKFKTKKEALQHSTANDEILKLG